MCLKLFLCKFLKLIKYTPQRKHISTFGKEVIFLNWWMNTIKNFNLKILTLEKISECDFSLFSSSWKWKEIGHNTPLLQRTTKKHYSVQRYWKIFENKKWNKKETSEVNRSKYMKKIHPQNVVFTWTAK